MFGTQYKHKFQHTELFYDLGKSLGWVEIYKLKQSPILFLGPVELCSNKHLLTSMIGVTGAKNW